MRRVVVSVMLVLMAVVILNILLRPLEDPDFFWHLATGRWIVENHAIPSSDPFSFTTPRLLAPREHFILTQYWLSQSMYYLFYALGGYSGIEVMNLVLAGLIIAFLWFRTRADDIVIFLGVLFLGLFALFSSFPMERPQAFSFLFFAALLFFLERLVASGLLRSPDQENSNAFRMDAAIYAIPPLMLLWSNMHGGYIMGQLTIIVYVITEGLKVLFPRLGTPMRKRKYLQLLFAGVLAVAASVANPNGYWAIRYFLSFPEYVAQGIVEYQSVVTILQMFQRTDLFVYLFLLLIAGICACASLLRKKADPREIILFLGLGFFSFSSIRYIPFFIIWSVPFISRFLSGVSFKGILRTASFLLTVMMFIFLLFQPRSFGNLKNIRLFTTGQWVASRYPEGAAGFLEANRIAGNMYNDYDWGGYLIWRLGPEQKVFIDGRGLYGYVFAQALQIVNASIEPTIGERPFYEATLDSYGVTHIVIPLFNTRGQMIPLFVKLLDDSKWKPVFFSVNSVIFAKDSPENRSLIYRFSIPRDYLLKDAMSLIDTMIKTFPQDTALYVAKGDLFALQKRYDDARRAYERAVAIYPLNVVAKERLRRLQGR